MKRSTVCLTFLCHLILVSSAPNDNATTTHISSDSVSNKTQQTLYIGAFCSEEGESSGKKKFPGHSEMAAITQTIKKSSKEAESLKDSFIRNVMNAIPDSLEAGLEEWHDSLLPQVPDFFSLDSLHETALESITLNLTSYANILQDIVTHTVSHEPTIRQRFQRLRNRLYFILCKIRNSFNISPSFPDDKHLTTKPEEKSKWNTSVYLVLRDYIKLLNHSLKAFVSLSPSEGDTVPVDRAVVNDTEAVNDKSVSGVSDSEEKNDQPTSSREE